MRKIGEKILLSASDLMRFIGCDHATTLDLQYLHHKNITPKADSDDAQLLQKKNSLHRNEKDEKVKAIRCRRKRYSEKRSASCTNGGWNT
jgi:hypothetical protein